MSSYFSNMPRDFLHQQVNENYRQDLDGNVKRLDNNTNSNGNWGKFMKRTPEFSICTKPENFDQHTKQKQFEYEQGKRSIYPHLNQDLERPQCKKHFQSVQSSQNLENPQKPGNLLNLLNKEDERKQEYESQHKKLYSIHNNDQTTQNLDMKINKHQKQKQKDFNSSQIETLPGAAKYEIQPRIEDNAHIHNDSCKMQKQMLYRSEITNLPGQQNCAKIQKQEQKEKQPSKDLHYIKFQHNSLENCPPDQCQFEDPRYKKNKLPSENDKHCQDTYTVAYYEDKSNKTSYKNQQSKDETIFNDSVCVSGCRKNIPTNAASHRSKVIFG